MPETVPTRLAEIPGLGPIRIRALNKFGLDTVESLKSASIETLMEVPGITEYKAHYIRDYLARFSLDTIRAAAMPPTQRGAVNTSLTQWESHTTSEHVSPLAVEAARALGAVIRILTSPHGVQLRNRLVGAFERFGQECQALITEAVTVQDREAEKSLRRLRKATERFIDIASQQEFAKRDQGNLADELAELSAWVAGLRTESAAHMRRPAKEAKDA
jgi:hypothetical protein